MVAGKVKAAMGFQKSPATPKHDLPRRSSASPAGQSSSNGNSKSGGGGGFARSFGVYFPRSSAQVQPRPPDVAADTLRLVEELQERESRLRTQLLEHKLLLETASIVPALESELAAKGEELERCRTTIRSLEEEGKRKDEKIKMLEAEVAELKRGEVAIDECLSASQRFQGLIDASAKSILMKSLMKSPKVDEEVAQEKRTTPKPSSRIPKPPPLPSAPPSRSSSSSSSSSSAEASTASNWTRPPMPPTAPPLPAMPPPPPPPPPAKGPNSAPSCVRRVPEVVEFYHSLMRRDTKRETGGNVGDQPSAANARNMIGEIENRSVHLLAIKTDVETQGDFIRHLIKEVNGAAFANVEDLVAFVKWLDDELSSLVDERAVLKHFDWPEQKADAMREAAFGYCDLKKLETEAATYGDDRRQPCSSSLKKMQTLSEKLEQAVYNVSRIREGAMKRYRGFRIPCEWMLDSGLVCQIKLSSVKLAMKYMKRVSSELESLAGGPEEEELMLQGVRFAFRVHQFAGGFDVETMRAFQELRDKARSLQSQKQQVQHHDQQQKLCISRSSMSLSC